MTREFRTVVDGQTYTEAPRWRDGRLFFSDLYTQRVQSVREDGTDLRLEAELSDDTPSGLGWLPDGRLLVVSMLQHKLLRREEDGSLAVHADLTGYVSGWANDLVVDATGRSFVGHFGFDLFGGASVAPTQLARVDPDGTVSAAGDGLYFPNGMTITADNVLLVGESFANRTTAFDLQPDGSLANQRIWAKYGEPASTTDTFAALGEMVVAADGMSDVDAEGAAWVADFTHGRVLRVHPQRGILEEVAPDIGVFAAALGGVDGRTLFISVAPDFDPEARRNAREGQIIATTVDVPLA